MKIRTRTLILVFSSLIVLVGALAFLSQNVLLKGFSKVEDDFVNDKAGLVDDAIYAMRMGIVSKAADWGAWDDAYEYVQNKNKKFEDSNFASAALPNLKINALAFFDAKGNPIKQIGHNLDEGTPTAFYPDLKKIFAA